MRLNAELLAPWYGEVVRQPSLFIAGAKDDVLKFPGFQAIATVRKQSGVFTLQFSPSSQRAC